MSRLRFVPLVVSLFACARGPSLELGAQKFPAVTELEQLASQPAQPPANQPSGPAIQQWELEQPLPDQVGVGPAFGASPGEQLLLGLTASNTALEADEQLTCAAHQFAHFIAQHHAAPTRALLRFMVHRCGVSMPSYRWAASVTPTPPQPSDAQALLDQYQLRGSVGLWVVPRGDEWVMVAFAGTDRASIEPLTMAVEGDQHIISGQLSGPRDWIMGHVSQGEHGVGACQNLNEAGDRFRLVCPVLPTDAGAYVDIFAASPGRMLGDLEARIWISPNGSRIARYDDSSAAVDPSAGPLDAAFVTALNQVREDVGARPLTLVAEQSQTVTSLRPHYREARFAGDGATIDQIVLGLLAGWNVGEPILAASFAELEFENGRLLDAVLGQPGLRAALLDPRATRIALAIDPGAANEVLGGMFTTYILAEPGSRAADRDWLQQLFDLARRSRGLPETSALVGGPEALAHAGRRLATGKAGLQAALDEALAEIAEQNPGHSIGGQVLLIQDARELEVPKELMSAGAMGLALHVELVQPADSPWATLAVFVAYTAK